MAKMGIQMIDMYTNMIRDQFAPLIQTFDSRDVLLREQVTVEVKKELGIYELTLKRAKLELAAEEIDKQLKSYEKKEYKQGYGHKTQIEILVDDRMRELRNGTRKEVEKARDDMIFKVKVSGVSGDTKEVFDSLPGIIEELTEKVAKLPAPKKQKQLK